MIRRNGVFAIFGMTLVGVAGLLLARASTENGLELPLESPDEAPLVLAAAPLSGGATPVAAPVPEATPRAELALSSAELTGRFEEARDLATRVAVLDAFARSSPSDEGAAALERLLDRPVPGPADDARRARIAVLLRLARYRDPHSEGTLASVAATLESHKQERLAAIEALGRRGALGPDTQLLIRALCDRDPEPDVRRAAGRLLVKRERAG